MTLRPDAEREWFYGAYYRAYVLQKDRADVGPAARVLARLRRRLRLAGWVIGPDDLLPARVERLYARTLIRLRNPAGRELLIRLFRTTARWPRDRPEINRFLSDFCADLTLIGLHDEAVTTAALVVGDAAQPDVSARRTGNLAAWHLQRAVSHRAARDIEAACTDLDRARELADEAVRTWETINRVRSTLTTRLQLREARAIRVSVVVERTAVGTSDLETAKEELHDLLGASLPVPRDETYLQVGYRIGRLGTVHLRSGDVTRARFYLEHAWRSSGNACVRPWLALDLLEALNADEDAEAKHVFASEAVARLTPQCGEDYPAVSALRRGTEI
jgi:hypothetical protein